MPSDPWSVLPRSALDLGRVKAKVPEDRCGAVDTAHARHEARRAVAQPRRSAIGRNGGISVIAAERRPRHNPPMAHPRHRRPPVDRQAPPRCIAFVIFQALQVLDLTGPLAIFHNANVSWSGCALPSIRRIGPR